MNERSTGDTSPPLTGTVSANLSGATIEVHILRPDEVVISRAGDIGTTSSSSSAWSLELQDGDLTVGGMYRTEVEATFSNGKIQTFAEDADGLPAYFNVRDQFA